jgi:hypothetical protein
MPSFVQYQSNTRTTKYTIRTNNKKKKIKKIPVEARFFAHVQTGPGAHPAFCIMVAGSFLGVKLPARGADHPTPPSAEVENE